MNSYLLQVAHLLVVTELIVASVFFPSECQLLFPSLVVSLLVDGFLLLHFCLFYGSHKTVMTVWYLLQLIHLLITMLMGYHRLECHEVHRYLLGIYVGANLVGACVANLLDAGRGTSDSKV